MANKAFVNYRFSMLRLEAPKLKKKLSLAIQALSALDSEVDMVSAKIENVALAIESFEATATKKQERVVLKMQERIDQLERQLLKLNGSPANSTNHTILSKVITIAIFDAILSAITTWSSSGDQASDVEAASQTVIFPCVYDRIMSGADPAYLLDKVPVSAELVVQRGREFVKWIRSECETHITSPDAWEKYAPQVQNWWLNDGLPLLYGEADPDWEEDTFYTLEQIEVWRNSPADRMMAFPKIHDAMDLLQKHRTEVNSKINFQSFNQRVSLTRLE